MFLDHSDIGETFFHIPHHSWLTVNLKQLFHHSQRLGSSGRAFYVRSFKLLETSVKTVVPIVKRSSRFVATYSGYIGLDPPANADERLSGPYSVVHLNIF